MSGVARHECPWCLYTADRLKQGFQEQSPENVR
jgi:hypothetical protein